MPGRNGFDTNQEMLADFTAASHGVFVAAYEKHFDGHFPEAYAGKPLNALGLYVTQRLVNPQDTLRGQELSVRPLHGGDVEVMETHLTMRHRPREIHDHYATVAATIGETTLDDNLDLRMVVPVEGVIADYTANLPDGRTRHVGTLKEKPTKFSLALGKTFAAEAAEYVGSEAFDVARRAPELARLVSDTTHRFSLDMRSDVPLNGYESTTWLNEYANKMFGQVQGFGERLERLKSLGAPDRLIEPARARYDEAAAALRRAEEILERK